MGISKYDKQALADLFIHMGVPLVTAMQTVDSWSGGEVEDASKRAERLAKLLNITVEFATKITKKLEIRDSYTLENVRGKIIRISTPIIADNYVTGGEIPSEESLKDLTELFDVLLSFADSVSPTDEKGSKPQKIAVMIEACEPIVSAVREHSFGLNAETAFNQIVEGLVGRANQMAPSVGLENGIESGLFKSIVAIYVSCYRKAIEDNQSGEEALEKIWSECDERLAIIQGLTGFVAQKVGIDTASPAPTTQTEEKPLKADKKAEKPAEKQENKDATQKDEKEDDEDDGEFNPMSFFG